MICSIYIDFDCNDHEYFVFTHPIIWFVQNTFESTFPSIIALTFFYKPRIKKVNPLLKAPKNELGVAEAALRLSACSQSEYSSKYSQMSVFSEPLNNGESQQQMTELETGINLSPLSGGSLYSAQSKYL